MKAKVVQSEREAHSSAIVVSEMLANMLETESWLLDVSEKIQEFEKIQDWKADQA